MATPETDETPAPPVEEPLPRREWGRWDPIWLTVITALAGILRFVRLDIPKSIVFDETYYAKDACWFVNTSKSICTIDYEQSFVHPPLGKWLIAIGIRLFGFDSFGWRVVAAVAGTITVALLYLLARRILRSTGAAVMASGLLAIDLLHFVQSRVAMLDIFPPLFGIAAILFVVYDRDRFRPPPGERAPFGLLDRPWRLAAGACAGAAVACKWTGLLYLVMVVLLTISWEISHRLADGDGRAIFRFLREETSTILMWLFVLPFLVYIFTYVGRLQGEVFMNPLADGSWWKAFWDRQEYMLDFHRKLASTHGYQSPPWAWIALKRPVSYYIDYGTKGEYAEIMATGSPFVWWASGLAILYVTFRWIVARVRSFRHREYRQAPHNWGAEGIIAAGVALTYGPWLLIDRPAVFIFYLLPTIPFMCLALTYVGTQLGRSWEARAAIALFAAGAIGFFAFYYPVVADVYIAKKSWDRRIWVFTDCDKPEATPTKSTITNTIGKNKTQTTIVNTSSNASLPPTGWCWI